MDRVPPILLAVDFSKPSVRAANAAAALAKDLGSTVVLVHAFAKPPAAVRLGDILGQEDYGLTYLDAQQELETDAAVELTTQWAAKLRKDGIDVATDAQAGEAVDVILAAAKKHEASIIVVGRQGKGFLKRALLGSVAASIVERSPVPVLIVPTPAERDTG